jgi:hypothetical protein
MNKVQHVQAWRFALSANKMTAEELEATINVIAPSCLMSLPFRLSGVKAGIPKSVKMDKLLVTTLFVPTEENALL